MCPLLTIWKPLYSRDVTVALDLLTVAVTMPLASTAVLEPLCQGDVAPVPVPPPGTLALAAAVRARQCRRVSHKDVCRIDTCLNAFFMSLFLDDAGRCASSPVSSLSYIV